MLDSLDRQIIEALVADGRQPFVRIAADLGVSEASVRHRAARLTAEGFMQITAVTNPFKMGYQVVAMLGLSVDPAHLREAGEALGALDEVTYLVACTGRHDFLVEVVCRDTQHLLRFMSERLAGVPGLSDTESFSYLSVLKESYRPFPGEW
jgi:Lrp/AsnC family transcriptional regulator, regulator for asnA, asnC and gidA